MPDVEIERLAGDGLEPSPAFVRGLRGDLQAEWRTASPRARRRSWAMWLGAAAAVALVVGLATLTSQTHDTNSIVTGSPSTSPLPPTSTTTPIPTTVLGHRWVVTWIDGEPADGPEMANFVFRSGDILSGWDGCHSFSFSPAQTGSSSSECPSGVTAAPIHGPFVFDSEFELHTARIVAERFDRTDLEAADIARTYRFADVGTVRLGESGVLEVTGASCAVAPSGHWTATNDQLRFDLGRGPECLDTSPNLAPFEVWLLHVVSPGVAYSFHDGPAGGLWTDLNGRVTRLARIP